MLSGSFFEIQVFEPIQKSESELLLTAVTFLNADHPIFKGHFPDNPVVPGVCQVQMVKELVEKALRFPVRLSESDNIKFLSMIDPQVVTQLDFLITIKQITEYQYTATATIGSGSSIFLKFRGKFEIEEPCQKS